VVQPRRVLQRHRAGVRPHRHDRQVFDDPARAEAMAARTMVGRNGEADDFAGVAVFLASRSSGYVTGQLVFVDGGFSAT
jgi:NAD(P)-dependent dehydrogenase (short-subunit alcohol dehydrogenase family)